MKILMTEISLVSQKSTKLLFFCLRNKRGELLLNLINDIGTELTDHL